MSRRKRRPKYPRIITQNGPIEAVIGVRVPPEQIESAREEGREQARAQNGAAIEQLRADAQALETTARILDDTPPLPRAQAENVVSILFAMAAGMRLAADRMPDSRDLPF